MGIARTGVGCGGREGASGTGNFMIGETPRLRNSVRDILAPELRKDGFRGSGNNYYREINEFVQIINLQKSKWGHRFAINLGLHPLCILMSDGSALIAKKIKEYHCVFRMRLREDKLDTWFEYDETQSSMDNAVKDALNMYHQVGRELLNEVVLPTSQLNTVTLKSFEEGNYNFQGFGNTKIITAWALARMKEHSGDYQGALRFANFVIRSIGDGMGGRGILPEIKQFVSETSNLVSN